MIDWMIDDSHGTQKKQTNFTFEKGKANENENENLFTLTFS